MQTENKLKQLLLDYELYDYIMSILTDIIDNKVDITPNAKYIKPQFELNKENIRTEAYIFSSILSNDMEYIDIQMSFLKDLKEYISFKLTDYKLLYSENCMYRKFSCFNMEYLRSLEALYIIIKNIYNFECIKIPEELSNRYKE